MSGQINYFRGGKPLCLAHEISAARFDYTNLATQFTATERESETYRSRPHDRDIHGQRGQSEIFTYRHCRYCFPRVTEFIRRAMLLLSGATEFSLFYSRGWVANVN